MFSISALRRMSSATAAASSSGDGRSLYPHLLAPITLSNGVTIRNRVVMGSMHTMLEEGKEQPYKRMANFFGERARGGTGMMITGGIAPNFEGRVYPLAAKMTKQSEADPYREVTDAVHAHGGKIIMQILHSGRYAYSPLAVAPSSIPSPLWKFSPMKPLGMPRFMINKTINDYARAARLARSAGFDGVEVMGSEGYLLNEFLVSHTNKRTDRYGGSFDKRMRFPLEVLEAVRDAVPKDFMVLYRVSMLDLISNGSTREEVFQFAEEVSKKADIITSGIGWHEARVPTIATSVPRATFTWVTKKTRDHLRSKGIETPLVTTNRINFPTVGEEVLARGDADFVSMARPMLADPHFVRKAHEARADEINVCIGCNQACLDHTFSAKQSTCLVNPLACNESIMTPEPTEKPKKIAIIGAGPGGIWAAKTLAERGHNVTMYEKATEIGGEFNLAKVIPGKEEFHSAVAFWNRMMEKHSDKITLHLNTAATVDNIANGGYDDVIVATGAGPRPKSNKDIKNLENNPAVLSYAEAIEDPSRVGQRVIVIGGGAIGFDAAVLFTHKTGATPKDFCEEWGVDMSYSNPGFLTKPHKIDTEKLRKVIMMDVKKSKIGSGLGATTGWVHRLSTRAHGVETINAVKFVEVTPDNALEVVRNEKNSSYPFDTIVLCHGQRVINDLVAPLKEKLGEKRVHVIGGAKGPGQDAKSAIRDGHLVGIAL